MKPLFEPARNVKVVLADRWQSIKILQDSSTRLLRSHGSMISVCRLLDDQSVARTERISDRTIKKVKTVEETLKLYRTNGICASRDDNRALDASVRYCSRQRGTST